MLASAGYNDLGGFVFQAVFRLEFVRNSLPQLRDSARGSVLSEPLIQGFDRRILDVLWRIKVRLSRSKTNHVQALGLHLLGLRVNRQCERGRKRRCSV